MKRRPSTAHAGSETRTPGGARRGVDPSLHFLSALMRNLPGMAYRCRNDREWTMEFVSDGCFDLTGYRPAELLESGTVNRQTIIHPDDLDSVWYEIQSS